MIFSDLLQDLICKKNIAEKKAYTVFLDIMSGTWSDIQISAFLTALQAKGLTVSEITEAVSALREKAHKIHPKYTNVIDTCGTGGDFSRTFNVSTISAVVIASLGVPTAKHGNRSASSKCGSADVLERLGVKIDLEPEEVQNCIDEIGIGFLFAPKFHPSMKIVAPVRKELGIKTIFNLLGPLCNPACAKRQIIGVYDPELIDIFIKVLERLGTKRAFVFHGNGLDEITVTGETIIYELNKGKIQKKTICPEKFGIKRAKIVDLHGGDSYTNARIFKDILSGAELGAKRDMVLLNSSAGLVIADKASDLSEGIKMAREAIDSGIALKKLDELIEWTNQIQISKFKNPWPFGPKGRQNGSQK